MDMAALHAEDAEETLVQRAQRGDRASFGRLFEVHAAMVHGILLARAPVRDIEDLMQDVFLAALERLSSLRNERAFGPWLCAIARHRTIDFLRARRPTAELADDIPASSKRAAR